MSTPAPRRRHFALILWAWGITMAGAAISITQNSNSSLGALEATMIFVAGTSCTVGIYVGRALVRRGWEW